MTFIQLGPSVRLQKVGDFPRPSRDPARKVPPDVTTRFPATATNLKCGPEGTWYATVEERGTVPEDGKKIQRLRHRIHWLTPSGDVRAAKALPAFHEAAFDADVASFTADRGELMRRSRAGGSMTVVPLAGQTLDDPARLSEIFLLRDNRIVFHASDTLILAARSRLDDEGRRRHDLAHRQDGSIVRARRRRVGGYAGVASWVVPETAAMASGAPLVTSVPAAPTRRLGVVASARHASMPGRRQCIPRLPIASRRP